MDRKKAQEVLELLQHLKAFSEVDKILSTFIPAFENKALYHGEKGFRWLHGNFNLGGAVSGRLSSCVAPWTPIATQRGLLPITTLQVGDRVWTHKRRWRTVLDVIRKEDAPMVDVTFWNGYILTCKISHKLYVPNHGWLSIQEIKDACIEEVDFQSPQHIPSLKTLSRIASNSTRLGKAIKHFLPQCQRDIDSKYAFAGIQSKASSTLFSFQSWRQKSNERENRRATPQLYRRLFRSQRLLNSYAQRKENIRTSDCTNGSIRFELLARWLGSTSYRWRSIKQSARQFSFVYKQWASSHTFFTGVNKTGKIKSINPRSSTGVWDISVEEDHSYWAQGCFHHNSDPNLQNLPSTGTRYAKPIKKCVEAPPGWIFVGADYSSLEDRISALTTKDPNKLKPYLDGYDGHCLRAYAYFKDRMPDIEETLESINSIETRYPKLRQDSKMPTFALTYFGTWRTLVQNGGFTKEEAQAIEENYHKLYEVADGWAWNELHKASQKGYAELAFGLRLRTPVLEQVAIKSETGLPKEAHKEIKTAGNALGQSYGLLNTRAANDFMERVWASKWRYSIMPVGQIHDAIYLVIENRLDCLKWVNDNLIDAMRWNELEAIQHPRVKLEAKLELYWPDWSEKHGIPNDLSLRELADHIKSLKLS